MQELTFNQVKEVSGGVVPIIIGATLALDILCIGVLHQVQKRALADAQSKETE